jgi:hypothetical protein
LTFPEKENVHPLIVPMMIPCAAASDGANANANATAIRHPERARRGAIMAPISTDS